MTRFRLILGAIVLAAIAYSAIWFTIAFDARDMVKARLADWRAAGATARVGAVDLGGFPYRIRLDLRDLRLDSKNDGIRFKSETARLISHVWTPGHWMADATGTTLHMFDGEIRITDDSLRASLRRRDGFMVMVLDSGVRDDTRLTRFPGLAGPANLHDATLFLRLPQTAKGRGTANGTDTDTGDGDDSGALFADRLADFKLVAAWDGGRLDMLGRLTGAGPLGWSRRRLARWRDSGGLLELDSLTLRLGTGQITGNGSLSLDEDLRPLGTLSLDYSGGDVLADGLGRAFGLKAAPVLSDGEGSLSVMMQGGQVTVGNTRLTALPPIL
ncbi:DUF2125 domain-containing protein [Yunchengibacter salinarum]|uniref:DUF2125 domain-containing protein n=1 Tax=Yunchengibacter salinarum TaxID=3133399 RepID=UPI0035B5DE27